MLLQSHTMAQGLKRGDECRWHVIQVLKEDYPEEKDCPYLVKISKLWKGVSCLPVNTEQKCGGGYPNMVYSCGRNRKPKDFMVYWKSNLKAMCRKQLRLKELPV